MSKEEPIREEDQDEGVEPTAQSRKHAPEWLTLPCLRFFVEDFDALPFVSVTDGAAERLDDIYRTLAQSVGEAGVPGVAPEVIARHAMSGLGAQSLTRSYERIVAEMVICRAADNFVSYIAELLALIFRTDPRTLAATNLTFGDVLEHPNMDDLVAVLTERRVSDLSRESFGKLSDYFQNKHQFDLISDAARKQRVTYFLALRNLIVHNRRIADRTFARQANTPDIKIGEPVPLGERDFEVFGLLREVVVDIDERGATKYHIDRQYSETDFWAVINMLRQGANLALFTSQTAADNPEPNGQSE